ncbi:hypothetical protein B7R21_06275 [Subtercola boreus]|uniref:Uncharacterized protein n=1 Tax=Subtercola boreus TaxID=120213 RepID=A0A3E0VYY4_9MICO|nr:hypothetical protein [Subtercola boreus]RFA14548.1 hypothetical protein B7R21_06275 [Subtercola boreus]
MIGFDITPYLPLIGIMGGGVVAGVFMLARGRSGDSSTKMPTVAEIWKRMDDLSTKVDALSIELNKERSARVTLRSVFLAYIERVRAGGTHNLTEAEKRALDLTENEREESNS